MGGRFEVHEGDTHGTLDRLVDERAATRELMAASSYAFDSRDPGWMGSLFTDDARILNGSGHAEGRENVVREIQNWQSGFSVSQHRICNLVLRDAVGR